MQRKKKKQCCLSTDWFIWVENSYYVCLCVFFKNNTENAVNHHTDMGCGRKQQLLMSVPLCWCDPWFLSALPIINTLHYSRKMESVTLGLILSKSRCPLFYIHISLTLKDPWSKILGKRQNAFYFRNLKRSLSFFVFSYSDLSTYLAKLYKLPQKQCWWVK